MYELPQNEWVVIFYEQTGATRLCPTLDFAKQQIASKTAKQVIYRNATDFKTRHDHMALERFWSVAYKNAKWALPKSATGSLRDYEPTAPNTDTVNLAALFWQMLQDIGDRLAVARVKTDTPKEQYEFKLGAMNDLRADEENYKEKYNNQSRILFEAILENGKQFMTEDEVKKLIYTLVANRELKTKQEPWTVWQYYRPQFMKDGYVLRGGSNKTRQIKAK